MGLPEGEQLGNHDVDWNSFEILEIFNLVTHVIPNVKKDAEDQVQDI